MDTNLSALVKRAKELQKEIDRLTAQQGRPEEPPYSVDTELATFSKWFQGSQRYEFAAIRPSGSWAWSVTGRSQATSVSWDGLMEFIGKDERRPKRAYDSFVMYEIDQNPNA